MARISEIRAAIHAALPEGDNHTIEVATGPLPNQPKLATGMGGGLIRQFIVHAVTGPPDDPASGDLLDELLEPEGDLSVQAALEADTTLGGLVHHLELLAASGWRQYPTPEGPRLGAELTIEIAA